MKKTLLIAVMAMATMFAQAQAWNSTVKLNGTYISSDNVEDLATVSGITSGTISYDYATNTLTLEDVAWKRSGINYFVKFEAYGLPLTVIVKGINELDNNGQQRSLFFTDAETAMTIKGESPETSKLICKTGNNLCLNTNSEMTLKDLTIECIDDLWSIGGYGDKAMGKKLTIENCNITAHPQYGMFDNLQEEIDFIDCELTKPEGATFDTNKHAIVVDGALLKDIDVEVTATKASGIESVRNTKQAQKVVENGVIYLLRDGKRFNVLGAEVR